MNLKKVAEGIFSSTKEIAKKKLSEGIKEVGNNVKTTAKEYTESKIEAGVDTVKNKVVTKFGKSTTTDIVVVSDNMTEEQEQAFEEKISNKLIKVGISTIRNPKEAVEVVKTLINVAGEVRKFEELQITKRVAIQSEKEKALAIIEMQKKILMTYLEKTFDERKDVFAKQFQVVDDAIQKGNIQQLAIGLDSINKLASTSPFKDLSSIEQVGKALDDKNHVWDF
jgi:hypothetical protein